MEGFVSRLDEINALAGRSPGFVWRLQSEDGDATAIQAFDDPELLINLSVWESLEALRAFVYDSTHVELLRGKQAWFDRSIKTYLALWWIPAGHIPSLEEARARLNTLKVNGPGPEAFSFRSNFPSPETAPAADTP